MAGSVGSAKSAGKPSTFHAWRLAEVAGLGFGVLMVGAVTADWRLESLPKSPMDIAELIIVVFGVASWIGVLLALPLSEKGRRYVMADLAGEGVTDSLLTRTDSLTIAGLVLAGLAVGPTEVLAGWARTLLTLALVAFVVGWAASYHPERMSSALIRDCMHWIGLTLLLGAVDVLGHGLTASRDAVLFAITGGTVAVVVYSTTHVLAHFRSADVLVPMLRGAASE